MANTKTVDESLLRRLWTDDQVTVTDIATKLGVSEGTVRQRATKLELGRRPRPVTFREPTYGPTHALTGGEWRSNGRGVMVWCPRSVLR